MYISDGNISGFYYFTFAVYMINTTFRIIINKCRKSLYNKYTFLCNLYKLKANVFFSKSQFQIARLSAMMVHRCKQIDIQRGVQCACQLFRIDLTSFSNRQYIVYGIQQAVRIKDTNSRVGSYEDENQLLHYHCFVVFVLLHAHVTDARVRFHDFTVIMVCVTCVCARSLLLYAGYALLWRKEKPDFITG